MLALEPRPVEGLWGNCFVCAGEMRIKLIEPHPASDHVERRTFECTRCGRTRIDTVGLTRADDAHRGARGRWRRP
jgi:hypothetical protein